MLTPDQLNKAKATANPAMATSTAGAAGMTPDEAQAWIAGKPAPAPAQPAGYLNPGGEIADQANSGVSQIKQAGSEILSGENPVKAAESGLKAESGAASIISAPLAPVFKPIGDVVQWLGTQLGSTKIAQDFVTKHPAAAADLSRITTDLSNAGNVAGTITGADAAVKAAPKVANMASDIATKAGDTLTPTAQTVSPADAAAAQHAQVHDTIDTEVRGLAAKYPSIGKVLNNAEVTTKTDPISVLSSYEGGKALPTIAKGKLQVDTATSFLKRQISRLSNIKGKLVDTSKEVTPVDDFQARTNAIIEAKDGWSLAKKTAMKADAAKIIDQWHDTYPDGIPNGELDSLKSEHTAESTAYNSKTPFAPDAHAIVGQTARQLVEHNSGEAPVEELNKLIQSHYEAVKLLNTMRGKAPHGGALSKLMNNTLGEVAGLGGGLAVGHPFIGAMIGRAGAEAINEIVNNHFISNPLKRSIVNNMKDADPVVVQKALDFLDKESGAQPGDDVAGPVDQGEPADKSQDGHTVTLP